LERARPAAGVDGVTRVRVLVDEPAQRRAIGFQFDVLAVPAGPAARGHAGAPLGGVRRCNARPRPGGRARAASSHRLSVRRARRTGWPASGGIRACETREAWPAWWARAQTSL